VKNSLAEKLKNSDTKNVLAGALQMQAISQSNYFVAQLRKMARLAHLRLAIALIACVIALV
jgi:hypothetical protein